MTTAAELLQQGRNDEAWQMCCGFTSLNIEQFMAIQKRLLEQLQLLNSCPLGKKVMRGSRPKTVEEFREQAPVTVYADYLPELIEKNEDILPVKPQQWVRTSGRSGEYPCRWVPQTPKFCYEMGKVMYGIGTLANCSGRGDTTHNPIHPKLVYTVAPRPYMSGAMATLLEQQTGLDYLPPLETAEGLSFEDRVKLGFQQSLSEGLDYFFGLSSVLVTVGEKFRESSGNIDLRSFATQPRALARLAKGLVKSKLAGRPMLPRDVWSVRGIMSSGLDSWVYRDKIKELWGKYPLDVYCTTEGGIIATQTWDYDTMTFIPNLDFFEFIPEDEHFKWQLDHSYQPRTVLMDEVKAGQTYEIVVTNFHGGALVRYRIGDMIRITSLRNEKLGIDIPQMVFERRADGLINFVVVQLTEKIIWQAIERAGIAYEDWIAYKEPGEPVLNLLIEPKNGYSSSAAEIAEAVRDQVMNSDAARQTTGVLEDLTEMFDFKVSATLLEHGAFSRYTARKQAEGADLAHLKPPHLNPSAEVLQLLTGKPAAEVARTGEKVAI